MKSGRNKSVYSRVITAFFVYLSTILDAYTKQVLADVLSLSLALDLVLETVNILIQEHGLSLDAQTLIHSDQGCHYSSLRFIPIVKDSGLRQSMSRRGNCWDNAPQESFFAHRKDKIDLSDCGTFDQVSAIMDDWIDYWNHDRYPWQLARPCLINGNVPSDDGFFRLANNFPAGILTDFKGKLYRPDGKRTVVWAC